MPLFKCSECGCVENTALSNFWPDTAMGKLPPLCSECDPKIGKWHSEFPKPPWDAEAARHSGMPADLQRYAPHVA